MVSVMWSPQASMRALSSWANFMRNCLSLSFSFFTIWILCGWKFNGSTAQTNEFFYISNKRDDNLWIESWGLGIINMLLYGWVTVTAVFHPDFLGVVILLVFTNFTSFLDSCYSWRCFLNFVQKFLWTLSLNEVQNDRWSPEYSILTGHCCCCCCCSMTTR